MGSWGMFAGPVEAITVPRSPLRWSWAVVCGMLRGAWRARGVLLSSWVPAGAGSGWCGKRGQARERGGELAGPRPRGRKMQGRCAGVECQSPGDVQQAVAQALGFDVGELAGQEQPLGPDDEVVREAHDRQPHLVVLEGSERQVAHPRVFVVADVVLDAGAAAVITLKRSDRPGLIGEDRLEAMTVVVGERQLRAGMRALAADNHSRAPRPGG